MKAGSTYITRRDCVSGSSPRKRERGNRAKLTRSLATLLLVSILWLRKGGPLDCDGLLAAVRLHDPSWEMCWRWGRAASRLSPTGGWDEGRGRLRTVVDMLLSKAVAKVNCDCLDEKAVIQSLYEDAKLTTEVPPFKAARLALPARAAGLNLAEFLDEDLLARFCEPLSSGVEEHMASPSFFNADMKEWQMALRRMKRIGLLGLLPAEVSRPALAAGAFPVRKDEEKDRLIADRRPMNSLETMICDPELPYVPSMTSMYVSPDHVLRVHARDLKDFYFQLGVPQVRWPLQQIGPRVPLDWFDRLEDESLDGQISSHWCWSDLHSRDLAPRLERRPVVQPCITAVMMGDLNGVSIAQHAHVNLLLEGGLLPSELRLKKNSMAWGRNTMIDVYIDDLCCVAARLRSEVAQRGWDDDHMDAADRLYSEKRVQQSSHKAVKGVVNGAKVWGAEIRGDEATVGAPHARRVGLLALGLLWLTTPATRGVAESIVGCLTGSFLFRRCLLCCFGQIYRELRSMRVRTPTPLSPQSANEICAASVLQLVALSELRWPIMQGAGASDASTVAGGAVWVDLPSELVSQLFAFVEHHGDYPLLDEGCALPSRRAREQSQSGLKDFRERAGQILGRAPWRVLFFFQFRTSDHINVLELRALIRLVFRISSWKIRKARILVGLDSKVVIGAASKGRSSSFALNYHLRRLAAVCLTFELQLLLFWLPTWGNPADAPSRYESLDSWRQKLPTQVLDWGEVLAQLREPSTPIVSAPILTQDPCLQADLDLLLLGTHRFKTSLPPGWRVQCLTSCLLPHLLRQLHFWLLRSKIGVLYLDFDGLILDDSSLPSEVLLDLVMKALAGGTLIILQFSLSRWGALPLACRALELLPGMQATLVDRCRYSPLATVPGTFGLVKTQGRHVLISNLIALPRLGKTCLGDHNHAPDGRLGMPL
eukprot:6491567-Amphidinium_carterae.2